jgi:predicted dithiol-disulfide oxidoreductase (DUF899 family)
MDDAKVASPAEAFAARKAFMIEEKAFTKARDALARKRRELPWTRVEKSYVFDSSTGPKSLADLFDGRAQLIVQHFMFAPDWDEGCVGCSFSSDHVDGALPHVQARDASFVAISRAPLEKLLAYKKRMGWRFEWVSSGANNFNYDFSVSFQTGGIDAGPAIYNYSPLTFEASDLSGVSVFLKDSTGEIYHTYSTFARGDEMLMTAYMYLDLLPRGRDEDGSENPSGWWRRHDRYSDAPSKASCCH